MNEIFRRNVLEAIEGLQNPDRKVRVASFKMLAMMGAVSWHTAPLGDEAAVAEAQEFLARAAAQQG